MDTDLDTLATALYVTLDDLLKRHPELAPWRPAVGMKPQVSDAELVTMGAAKPDAGWSPPPAADRRRRYRPTATT